MNKKNIPVTLSRYCYNLIVLKGLIEKMSEKEIPLLGEVSDFVANKE